MNAWVSVSRPRRRIWWPWVALLVFGLVALPAALLALLLRALAPAEGEWSTPLKLGPITRPVGVPALIRIATHPIGLTLLDGRSTATRYGEWQWQRASDERLVGRCAPCTLQLAALGPAPITLPAATFTLKRNGQNRYDGTLTLGTDDKHAHAVALQWHAKLSDTGLAIQAQMDRVPLADAYATLGAAAVPELVRARIEGSIALKLAVMLPEQRVLVEPRVEGFAVDGLGTEALLNAEPPSTCRGARFAAPGNERLIGWLPRAVVAAEDQRFQEHAGYDLEQLLAAFASNQQQAPGSAPQGASTLTQQLAKWVYVGDERSAVRKLRELLYAMEMERTLGKGRILQLYLALAPWGEGVCGAEWASRHYLHKPAARLTPLEAAWLASLLRHGDGHVADAVDTERVGWVLASLRGPLSAERRAEQLELLRHWAPPGRRSNGDGLVKTAASAP